MSSETLQTSDLEALNLSSKVPLVTDFKSVNISLIIGSGGLQYETNLKEIMGWEFWCGHISPLLFLPAV